MVKEVARCSHCGGNLLKEDGTRKCLQCGRTWRTIPEISEFYDSHKKEILADIADLGRVKAAAKWQIPDGSVSKILRRFLHQQGQENLPAPARSTNHQGPELPAFSNDWTPEVQIKWLEVYGQRR